MNARVWYSNYDRGDNPGSSAGRKELPRDSLVRGFPTLAEVEYYWGPVFRSNDCFTFMGSLTRQWFIFEVIIVMKTSGARRLLGLPVSLQVIQDSGFDSGIL